MNIITLLYIWYINNKDLLYSTENSTQYVTCVTKECKKWLNMLCYAKSLQSCLTLCDPIDDSPPGSPIPGILQARTLEWVAIAFSNAWKWKVKVRSLSRVRLLATPWTTVYQAPPSMGFSRQEYWSGVPLPPPVPLLENLKYSNWQPRELSTQINYIGNQ